MKDLKDNNIFIDNYIYFFPYKDKRGFCIISPSIYEICLDLIENNILEPNMIGKRIYDNINKIKENQSSKEFKKFIASHELVDADFVDKNYGLFEAWEIGAIISVKQMGEAFLEKYFGALDLDKVARYQEFSEQFFMKHFSQLDATIVLTKGKNTWRKKENRSKQLDVFLRLKGVKI